MIHPAAHKLEKVRNLKTSTLNEGNISLWEVIPGKIIDFSLMNFVHDQTEKNRQILDPLSLSYYNFIRCKIASKNRGVLMPVYTYRCENCGIQFDQTQKFSDPPLTKCPECGKKSLKKVYTPVGIVFKGSGFYATDHRSPSGNTPHSTAKHEEPKPADKPETTGGSAKSTENTTPAAGEKD